MAKKMKMIFAESPATTEPTMEGTQIVSKKKKKRTMSPEQKERMRQIREEHHLGEYRIKK